MAKYTKYKLYGLYRDACGDRDLPFVRCTVCAVPFFNFINKGIIDKPNKITIMEEINGRDGAKCNRGVVDGPLECIILNKKRQRSRFRLATFIRER